MFGTVTLSKSEAKLILRHIAVFHTPKVANLQALSMSIHTALWACRSAIFNNGREWDRLCACACACVSEWASSLVDYKPFYMQVFYNK